MLKRLINPSCNPIGCDIGRRWVRLAQVQEKSGTSRLVAESREIPDDLEPEHPGYAAGISALIRDALRTRRFVGRRAASCFPEQELCQQTLRLVPMPEAELAQAVHLKMAHERGVAPGKLKSALLTFGKVVEGGKPRIEVLGFGADLARLEEHVSMLIKGGLTPIGIDAAICAVSRSVMAGFSEVEDGRGARKDQAVRMILCLSHDSATVAMLSGDEVVFVKPGGAGLKYLDELSATMLEVTPVEANQIREVALSSPPRWPFEGVTEEEASRAISEASRMYGRELARHVGLATHYWDATLRQAQGGMSPEIGTVVAEGLIGGEAVEAVTIQSGIEFGLLERLGKGGWDTELEESCLDAHGGGWARAIGLSLYEQASRTAEEAA